MGTITIINEELEMCLNLSMKFPQQFNLRPWKYLSMSNGNSCPSSAGEQVNRGLKAENSIWKGITTAESSSWLRGHSEFIRNGSVWQTKTGFAQQGDANPAINAGSAFVRWMMTFVVTGSDVSFDFFSSSTVSADSTMRSWILDLTNPGALQYLNATGTIESRVLSDGHQYQAGLISELDLPLFRSASEEQSSEMQLINADIKIALFPPVILLQ